MGAKLGTLGGVEGPLEKGADDGGLDVAPVLVGGLFQVVESVQGELNGVDGLEQIAVEVGHLVSSEEAATGHPAEQVAGGLVEQLGMVKVLSNNLGKQMIGQQPGVLGVEAKDYLVQVAGELFGINVALFHVADDGVEEIGGLPGQGVKGAVGPEVGGRVKDPAQGFEMFLLIEAGHRDVMSHGLHSGEIGLDANGLEGGDDQQGRGLEMDLVPEQLVQGAVEF